MINATSHRPSVPFPSHSAAPASTSAPRIVSPGSRPTPFPPSNKNSKQQIAANFGQSAQTYQAQAHLQRRCGPELLDFLAESCGRQEQTLPDGPILEIGCGTGFITQHLIDRFLPVSSSQQQPFKHTLHITDLSPDMVAFCQENLNPQLPASTSSATVPHSPTPISFHVLDAETLSGPPQTYSLIIGGFVAQWFKSLARTVATLRQQLKPGGRLVLSFPGHQSFPEWRQWCDRLDLPYTAHPLPNPHKLIQHLDLSPHEYDLHIEMCPTYYNSAKDFFKSMKGIGAGGSDAGYCLTPKQMRRLLRQWQPSVVQSRGQSTGQSIDQAIAAGQELSQIEVHYEVVFLSILG